MDERWLEAGLYGGEGGGTTTADTGTTKIRTKKAIRNARLANIKTIRASRAAAGGKNAGRTKGSQKATEALRGELASIRKTTKRAKPKVTRKERAAAKAGDAKKKKATAGRIEKLKSEVRGLKGEARKKAAKTLRATVGKARAAGVKAPKSKRVTKNQKKQARRKKA